MPMHKPTVITLHCICGMSMTLTFRLGATPEQIQKAARCAFDLDHSGAEHAPCDEGTATRKRATWQRRMFDAAD